MQKGYKARFFDNLLKNLRDLSDQLTEDEKGNLLKSLKNTCLFAKALQKTFDDVGDVAGIMLMLCGCDYTPLES